jgi:hypothetical protein
LNNPILAKLKSRALREEKAAAEAAASVTTIEGVDGMGDDGDQTMHA